MIDGAIGKVRNRGIEVSFLVNDLEGEGFLIVTVDVDVGTLAEVGCDVGGTGGEFTGDVVVKYGCDAGGVAGIGGDGCKKTEGNETGSQAETDKDQAEMQLPVAVDGFHHFHTPLYPSISTFFIVSGFGYAKWHA